MIRCNNCGWFNPDSAKRCEMCDEELTGLPIENPAVVAAENEEPVPMPEPEPKPKPAPEPETKSEPKPKPETKPEPEPESKPTKSAPNPMMATVQMGGAAAKVSRTPSFTQTVLDASDIMESDESVECPKCRYPVYGYVDTCPNCGASLKRVMAEKPQPQAGPSKTVKEDETNPAPAAHPDPVNMKGTVLDGKAMKHPVIGSAPRGAKETVREIPKELISDQSDPVDAWCLIPVESPDSETIYMREGEIIRIGNRRYMFKKQ